MSLDPARRAQLRQFLVDRFSLDDLKDLAFDLGVDYEKLPHGTTQELARELIAYSERQEQAKALIAEALERRPDGKTRELFADLLGQLPETQQSLRKALSNEIALNLAKVQEFIAKEYRIVNDRICSEDGEGVLMDYFTCMTNVFLSYEAQKEIALMKEDVQGRLFAVYRGFQDINDKAEALNYAFRAWRASLYLDAVMSFDKTLRPTAADLSQDLSR